LKKEIFSSTDLSAATTKKPRQVSPEVPPLKDADESNKGTDWMAEYNSMFGGGSAAPAISTVALKPPAPSRPIRNQSNSSIGTFTPSVDLSSALKPTTRSQSISSIGTFAPSVDLSVSMSSVDLSNMITPSMDFSLTSGNFMKEIEIADAAAEKNTASKLTSDITSKIGELMEKNIQAAQTKKAQTKKKKAKRNREPEVKEYVEPSDLDCLLGRGGKSNHHPGNKKYREEVLSLQEWYKSSSKNEKTDLSQLLVDRVHSYGGKFLKMEKETGLWYIVTNIVARRKCSQALREHIPPEERQARRAQINAAKATG